VKRWPQFKGKIHAFPVGMASSIPLHFYLTRLRSIVRSYAPDVLIAEEEPYSLSAWQAFYASRGMKMTRVVYSAQNLHKRYPPPFRQMERYVLQQADLALAVSEDVVSVLRQKQYQGRHMLFPLGVDTEQFQPNKLKGRLQRVTCGIREHSFVVGFVGRFVEIKGIRLILDAIARCEDPDITYVMVGTGPLLPEVLEMQSKRPDKLYVATQVVHREVQHWMNMMDVLLLPSITLENQKEQFGRVIVEANACGVPVIGSTSGEIPRLIRTTTGGWVVPENDAQALREKIIYVKDHVEERYSVAASGLEYVRRHLSKQAIASQLSMNLSEISQKGAVG
jgi:glycosyltransferase involved in cell wall biosynthesis